MDKDTVEELQQLAKRIDREYYKVNNAIQDYEVEFDMDAVVEEVLENLELDGREITCTSTPDAPDADIDIDTEALEGVIGELVTKLEELAEEAPEAPVTAPSGITLTLTPEEAELVSLALLHSNTYSNDKFAVAQEAVMGLPAEMLNVSLADIRRKLDEEEAIRRGIDYRLYHARFEQGGHAMG